MKQTIKSAFDSIIADRVLMLLVAGIIIGAAVYTVFVIINLNPTDLQLAIRYTAFGETQIYREKWWYLLSFIGFGLLFLVAHVGMVAKLIVIGLRDLARAFASLSFVMLALMFVYTYSVLNIAYLN